MRLFRRVSRGASSLVFHEECPLMAHDQLGASYAPVHHFVPTPPPFAVRDASPPAPDVSLYVFPRAGAPVDAAECEDPVLEAVEVTVMWGTNVLAVTHLAPP